MTNLKDKIFNSFVLKGHKDCISYLSWSSKSDFLCSCSNDKSVKIWDIEQKKLYFSFEEHLKAPCACCFILDDKFVLSAGGDDECALRKINVLLKKQEEYFKFGFRIIDMSVSKNVAVLLSSIWLVFYWFLF
jgi:WD40 repeat protein